MAAILSSCWQPSPRLEGRFDDIITVVPIYATFLLIMAFLGLAAARTARLDPGRARD
jgi:arsenite transporter